jgi:uncharacterized membrane protein HdeD (DUF308 family)
MMTLALRNWWYLVLRGVFSILFGITALLFPGQTVTALVLLFGAYSLVDGLIAILYAISVSRGERVWTLLIEGALGVLIGVVTFLWPHITARIVLYLIAFWAILTGVLEIAAMAWLKRLGLSGLLLTISGVFSVALGVALFFVPEAGMVALTWLLGSYALVFGALLIWFGLQLRRLARG